MKDEILDDNVWTKFEINTTEDIKTALTKLGIHSFYEHKNGSIIVNEGDAINITIHYTNNVVSIKPNFPTIGNSVQVITSATILAILLWVIPIPLPLPWIFAIIGGQLISYYYYTPKTKMLKERIERYM